MTRTNPATARARRPLLLVALATLAAAGSARAADAPAPGQEFLQFVRTRAAALRADDAPPRSLDDWNARRPVVRARLAEALGTVPDAPSPLEPQTHGDARPRRLPRREGHLPDPARRPDDGQPLRARRPGKHAGRSSPSTATGAGRSKTRWCSRAASARRSSGSSCWPSTPSAPASAASARRSASTTAR